MDVDNFDVEKYRSAHECESDWKIRRSFMLSNYKYLNEDQLICLANCYVNVNCYGCAYPDGVMQKLSYFECNVNRASLKDYKNIKTISGHQNITSSNPKPQGQLHRENWRAPPNRSQQNNSVPGPRHTTSAALPAPYSEYR